MTDAKHEAPAEGAGDLRATIDAHDDNAAYATEILRARSSAPEAREGEQPFSYAYRYPDPMGGTVVRLDTNGREINGSRPIEAIPLYTHPAAPSADKLREVRQAYAAVGAVVQRAILEGAPDHEVAELARLAVKAMPSDALKAEGA